MYSLRSRSDTESLPASAALPERCLCLSDLRFCLRYFRLYLCRIKTPSSLISSAAASVVASVACSVAFVSASSAYTPMARTDTDRPSASSTALNLLFHVIHLASDGAVLFGRAVLSLCEQHLKCARSHIFWSSSAAMMSSTYPLFAAATALDCRGAYSAAFSLIAVCISEPHPRT